MSLPPYFPTPFYRHITSAILLVQALAMSLYTSPTISERGGPPFSAFTMPRLPPPQATLDYQLALLDHRQHPTSPDRDSAHPSDGPIPNRSRLSPLPGLPHQIDATQPHSRRASIQFARSPIHTPRSACRSHTLLGILLASLPIPHLDWSLAAQSPTGFTTS